MRLLSAAIALAMLIPSLPVAHEDAAHNPVEAPKLETLLTHVLEGVPGTEVILSRVSLPPGVTLPLHWHPGEEFAYVLQGSLTLIQKGAADQLFSSGEAGVVPLRRVHTARAGDQGVTLLVFRVHEQGQPERVPVDN